MENTKLQVSVFDVATYILSKMGLITAMKLQKLVYYCQAWSLVWDEAPLFTENIEAWANGPVVRELYEAHRGSYQITSINRGSIDNLNRIQRNTIDAVLKFYGKESSQWLSDLTHMEDPWQNARHRGNLSDNERGSEIITHADLMEYYGGLE